MRIPALLVALLLSLPALAEDRGVVENLEKAKASRDRAGTYQLLLPLFSFTLAGSALLAASLDSSNQLGAGYGLAGGSILALVGAVVLVRSAQDLPDPRGLPEETRTQKIEKTLALLGGRPGLVRSEGEGYRALLDGLTFGIVAATTAFAGRDSQNGGWKAALFGSTALSLATFTFKTIDANARFRLARDANILEVSFRF